MVLPATRAGIISAAWGKHASKERQHISASVVGIPSIRTCCGPDYRSAISGKQPMTDPKLKDISAIRLETVARWRTESRENN
jgi:hypothetical protein